MKPIWGTVAGAFILLMMLVFIGIWIWAWLPGHRRTFDDLARLPMQDDDVPRDTDSAVGDRR